VTELFCDNEKKSSCVSQLQYLIPVSKKLFSQGKQTVDCLSGNSEPFNFTDIKNMSAIF
jgi:hypothetical protein